MERKSEVKACPDSCNFNWGKFQEDLDIAVAHLIREVEVDTPPEEYLPSKTPILYLISYVYNKKGVNNDK